MAKKLNELAGQLNTIKCATPATDELLKEWYTVCNEVDNASFDFNCDDLPELLKLQAV